MGHHHGPVGQVARRTRLLVLGLLLPLLGLTVVLLVVLRPDGEIKVDALQSAKARGVVTALVPCPLAPDECDRATVRLTDGVGAGTVVTARAVKHPLVPRVQVLAYAGAALPMLMLFSISGVPETYVLSTERVAVEVVRALVGGLGIIAAVPITTALATALAKLEPVPGESVDAGRGVEDGVRGGVAGADGEVGDGAAVADRGTVAAADPSR